MPPRFQPNGAVTDYDHEIPGVVVDADPRVDELKTALMKTSSTLIRGGLVTSDQIAEIIVGADSIKELSRPSTDPFINHIARSLLETCDLFRTLNLSAADRAYEDFRTEFLLGRVPRVPYFEKKPCDNDISSRHSEIRTKLIKQLPKHR